MNQSKNFGLILPKKLNKVSIISNPIFGSDSDEDISKNKRSKITRKILDPLKKVKTESVEDPSIYEYDSIYDDMKAKQIENTVTKEKKNSRYIETLLKAADKRKKEYERRVEKKIQVEREKEGDKFKDKESFVTSAYKKKMEEMEEEEERERRENMLNDMMDVTKQKDLSGFYRHFLKQTIGEEKVPTFGENRIKEEIISIKEEDVLPVNNKKVKNVDKESDCSNADGGSDDVGRSSDGVENGNVDRDSDGIEIDSDSNSENNKKEKCSKYDSSNSSHENYKFHYQSSVKSKKLSMKKCRKYRSNKSPVASETKSSSSSGSDTNEEENLQNDKKGDPIATKLKQQKEESEIKVVESDEKNIDKIVEIKRTKNEDIKEFNKQNIFIKRTVGDVFSSAQARYFQRMANKNIA